MAGCRSILLGGWSDHHDSAGKEGEGALHLESLNRHEAQEWIDQIDDPQRRIAKCGKNLAPPVPLVEERRNPRRTKEQDNSHGHHRHKQQPPQVVDSSKHAVVAVEFEELLSNSLVDLCAFRYMHLRQIQTLDYGRDVVLDSCMQKLVVEAKCSTSMVRKEKNFQIAVIVLGQLTSMLVKKAADT